MGRREQTISITYEALTELLHHHLPAEIRERMKLPEDAEVFDAIEQPDRGQILLRVESGAWPSASEGGVVQGWGITAGLLSRDRRIIEEPADA